MGRVFVELISTDPGFELVGATASPASPNLDKPVGSLIGRPAIVVPLTAQPSSALQRADVAIDVALPVAASNNLEACVAADVPLVMGTTGHDQAIQPQIVAAAARIPVLVAPNMSLGVNVLLELAERAARALDAGFDAEIFEAHHRHKRDAPSGTALAIGEAVARGRGANLADVAVYTRHGPQEARMRGSIGFAVLRAGEVVGEHVLTFAGPGERIELAHRASDRSTFARGGLEAARWLAGRAPGQYSMRNVLAL